MIYGDIDELSATDDFGLLEKPLNGIIPLNYDLVYGIIMYYMVFCYSQKLVGYSNNLQSAFTVFSDVGMINGTQLGVGFQRCSVFRRES